MNNPRNQGLEGCHGIYWGHWGKAALDQPPGALTRQLSRNSQPFNSAALWAKPPAFLSPVTQERHFPVDKALL